MTTWRTVPFGLANCLSKVSAHTAGFLVDHKDKLCPGADVVDLNKHISSFPADVPAYSFEKLADMSTPSKIHNMERLVSRRADGSYRMRGQYIVALCNTQGSVVMHVGVGTQYGIFGMNIMCHLTEHIVEMTEENFVSRTVASSVDVDYPAVAGVAAVYELWRPGIPVRLDYVGRLQVSPLVAEVHRPPNCNGLSLTCRRTTGRITKRLG